MWPQAERYRKTVLNRMPGMMDMKPLDWEYSAATVLYEILERLDAIEAQLEEDDEIWLKFRPKSPRRLRR